MTNLSNGRHGKLDREITTHRVQELILLVERLVLLVRGPAVLRDKGIHIGCIGGGVGSLSTCNDGSKLMLFKCLGS